MELFMFIQQKNHIKSIHTIITHCSKHIESYS